MPFSQLIGNESIQNYLLQLIKDQRLPQVMLFHGPSGVGKCQFAIALAQALQGEKHTARIAKESHPDVSLLKPEGKINLHTIDALRALISATEMPPFEAPYKVFIIDDVDRMLPTSSNALLKTLEEPPADTYFILVTSDIKALLPTIVSRAQAVHFAPIGSSLISQCLLDKYTLAPSQAASIAKRAQGSIGQALLLHERLNDPIDQLLLSIFEKNARSDLSILIPILNEIEKHLVSDDATAYQKRGEEILEWLFSFFRDMHALQNKVCDDHLFFVEHKQLLVQQLQHFTLPLEHISAQIDALRTDLSRSFKIRNLLEYFFLKQLEL